MMKQHTGLCAAFETEPCTVVTKEGDVLKVAIVRIAIEANAFREAPLNFHYEGEHAMRAFAVFIFEQCARMLREFGSYPATSAELEKIADRARNLPTSDELS